jgi:proteasome lid subunit RPN8/RPN11
MSENNDFCLLGKAALEVASFTLDKEYKGIFSRLADDVKEGNSGQAKNELELLLTIAGCKRSIQNAIDVIDRKNGMPLYVCSARFLRESLAYFSETAKESMMFVSGPELANIRILSKSSISDYSERSMIFVSAKGESYRRILGELTSNGQRLLAWFHSHPGTGSGCVNPSSIDMCHQQDLESGGYETIGAIFARDGHIKFFSYSKQFQVEIIGKGVKKLNEKLFRIDTRI